MTFASSLFGFGSIATAIILEFKYLTKKKKENKIIIKALKDLRNFLVECHAFFLFIFVERYNLFKILEKLKITLWLCLRHSWWVDPLLVVRGDPYAQSQQPVKLQKKKK